MTQINMQTREDINKQEIELYETKFYDYRAVSPDVATMQFMLAYGRAMEGYNDRLGYSKHRHIFRSIPSMRLSDLRSQPQFSQLAKLRRWADKYGMPYKFFWSYATEAHLKLAFHQTYIPIFGHKAIKLRVKEAWDEWRTKFSVPRSNWDFFRAENFDRRPLQCDYYDYVLGNTIKMYGTHEAARRISELVSTGELAADYVQEYVNNRRQA